MSENTYRLSMGIDNAIRSGNPIKASATALINYIPATLEMMKNGQIKPGLGLLLLSFIGIPIAMITTSILAITNRRQ